MMFRPEGRVSGDILYWHCVNSKNQLEMLAEQLTKYSKVNCPLQEIFLIVNRFVRSEPPKDGETDTPC